MNYINQNKILTFLVICVIIFCTVPFSRAAQKKVYTINFNTGHRVKPVPENLGAHDGVHITYGKYLRTWEAGSYVGKYSCFKDYVAVASGTHPGSITFTAPKDKAVRIIGFGSGYSSRRHSDTSTVSFYVDNLPKAIFTMKLTDKIAQEGFYKLPQVIAAKTLKMVIQDGHYSDRAIDNLKYTLMPISHAPKIDRSALSVKSKKKVNNSNTHATNSSRTHVINFNLGKHTTSIADNYGAQGGVSIKYGRYLGAWTADYYKNGAHSLDGYVAYASGTHPGTITFTAPKGKQVKIIGFDSGYPKKKHSGTTTINFYINGNSKSIYEVTLTDNVADTGFTKLPDKISGHTVKLVIQDHDHSDRVIDNIKYKVVSKAAKSSKTSSHKDDAKQKSKSGNTNVITFEQANLSGNGKPVPSNTGAVDGVKVAYHNLHGWSSNDYKSGSDSFSGYVGYAPHRETASITFTAPADKKIKLLGFDSGYAKHSGTTALNFYIDSSSKPALTVKLTDEIADKGFFALPDKITGNKIKIVIKDGRGSDRAIDNIKYKVVSKAANRTN